MITINNFVTTLRKVLITDNSLVRVLNLIKIRMLNVDLK